MGMMKNSKFRKIAEELVTSWEQDDFPEDPVDDIEKVLLQIDEEYQKLIQTILELAQYDDKFQACYLIKTFIEEFKRKNDQGHGGRNDQRT